MAVIDLVSEPMKKGVSGAGGFAAGTGVAKAAQMRDPVAHDDGEGYTRNVQVAPLLRYIGVNGSIRRGMSSWF